MEKRQTIKKWLLCTGLILMSMLAGTSCVMDNDDLPDCPPEPVPSKDAPAVTAYIYCNNKRIDWEEGNKIGVYMIDNEREVLLQDSLGAPYVLNDNPTGLFIPQWGVGDQVLTRPELGVTWDATGIYPYGTSLKNTNTFNLSILDQKAQDKLDVFTAKRVTNVTAYTDTLHLDLYRRMSRILFNMTLTEVKADKSEAEANDKLAGATIQVSGLPVNGTFTFSDNTLKTSDVQPFQAYVTENGKQGQAIVFPAESTKDVRFLVSLPQYPDTVYSFVLNEEIILEECNSYEFEMNMKYVYKPEVKKYNVKYRYEGAANKDNVIVTRGDGTTLPWGEGDVIVVDENSDFTFRYTSSLQVSVRTEDGETLPMTSGKPYTFEQIQKDITVIIYVEEAKPDPDPEPEKTYKVTYRYEGEANANNVNVFKNGMSTAWAQTETITVKENEDFTFGFRSDMVVTVKTKDGENLSMGSGNPYTFTKINKDIEIIIYAETPEYAVKYVFVGTYTEQLVTVQKKVQNAFNAWGKTETVWVREGNDFTFRPDSEVTVTVKVNDKELPKNADGSYTLKDITENITVVISTNVHKVIYKYVGESANKTNVSVYRDKNLTEAWEEETEIVWVEDGKDFAFGTDSHYGLVVTDNDGMLTPSKVTGSITQNTFEIKNITKDITVLISAETEEDLENPKVIYVLTNAAVGNTTVTTSAEAWTENTAGIKSVKSGDSFSFTATSKYTLTVTALYPNDPKKKVEVAKNGNEYTISGIEKNVLIYISATTYTVDYAYTGTHVSTTTVPVKDETTPVTIWKPGTDGMVTVDNDGSFKFTNTSNYTITVSGYNEPFTLNPGNSYTLSNIKENISLIITANIYKVSYVFDNDPADNVATWVDVKHQNTAWSTTKEFYLEKDKDFSFSCGIKAGINGRIIYVKEAKDGDLTSTNGNYTLSKIQADKEIHIKAVKTYTVYYKYADGTTPPNDFEIWKKTPDDNKNVDWTTAAGERGKVTLDAGSNFEFGMNKKFEVSSTNNTVIAKGENYQISNIQKDEVIILDAGSKPYVTIVDETGSVDVVYNEHSDYVTSGNSFTIIPRLPENLKDKYSLKITGNKTGETGTSVTVTEKDGSYTVTNVTEDTDIVIRAIRKPADVTIEAVIKDWTELKEVNGGTLFPDK